MPYKLRVPPTREQGSYNITISPHQEETVNQCALYHYNSARAHDGLPPLRRMPNGTRYTRVMEYTVQGLFMTGWEDLTTEETHNQGRERLKEYRENAPQRAYRLIARQAE